MDLVPKFSIKSLCIGDVMTGQDGNKYIVCDEAGIMYWKPHVAGVTNVTNVNVTNVFAPSTKPTHAPKPIKKVKEVKEKYYWKDNDKKPKYEGDNRSEMSESLKPKVSPTKFPAGYVWTTKFSNISYVVDTEYKGYSKTSSRFWNVVYKCPPCLDAEDYPYEYYSGDYCVVYDEQGNKFWSEHFGIDESSPIQYPYKFHEGTYQITRDGTTRKRTVDSDGVRGAWWERQSNNDTDCDDE
jgi:hypothetical protein